MNSREQDGNREHIDPDRLNAYLDGSLPADERGEISAHLVSCADCRRELSELRAIVALLHQLPQFDPPVSFQLGDAHAVQGGTAPTRLVRLLPVVRVLAVAAVLAFAIASGFLVVDRVSRSGETTEQHGAQGAMAPAAAPASDIAGNGGGTGEDAEASMTAEEVPTAQERRGLLPSSSERSSPLIDRGESASANGAPPGSAAAVAPQQSGSVDEEPTPKSTTSPGASSDVETVDSSAEVSGSRWLVTSIGLGLLVVFLVGLWVALTRLGRQRGVG